MTNKQRKSMIERWVTQLNPKAVLRKADVRCGNRYAVYVVEKEGDYGNKCTYFLPLKELEQYLLGVFHSKDFYTSVKLEISSQCM